MFVATTVSGRNKVDESRSAGCSSPETQQLVFLGLRLESRVPRFFHAPLLGWLLVGAA